MRALFEDLALDRCPAFFRDRQFIAALIAGLLFWIALRWAMPNAKHSAIPIATLLSLCVIQPLLEELIFRGVMQTELLRHTWGALRKFGLSSANLMTSALFTGLHFFSHSPLWALAVLIPSLLFGHFRERHNSLYPPLALHIYYNTGYFLTIGFPV